MSEIDSYKHECIGVVKCPSHYEIVYKNNTHRNIPLYRLTEDGLDAQSWQAKRGDLLLGGGSGESAAFRLSMPEAVYFFTHPYWDSFESLAEIFHAYWTLNEAYVFCEGYAKLGWTPKECIEIWLAEHILAFVSREYAAKFELKMGPRPLGKDGSIVRLPSPEERKLL